jgi:isopropylmalate/homocitrate/citramalate synthase
VVAEITAKMLDFGCYEISLGDTIGVGTARTVSDLLDEVLKVAPAEKIAVHFHDTYGQALANVLVAIEVCFLVGPN